MNPLCVVLLSGRSAPGATETAITALENRGFEVFSDKPISGPVVRLLPDGFDPGGHALVAYNSLMTPNTKRPHCAFADFEVEKAVLLLAATVPNARDHVRVTENALMAEALAKNLLSQAEYEQLLAQIVERQSEMETEFPVLADLSRFKYRAKVELVNWNGVKAVKKTFRRTGLDAMARELEFFDDMAAHSDVPPRVLARTENAIFFEHIENCMKTRRLFGFRLPIPLRLGHVRELAEFTELLVDRGWDPIDLTPRDNILIDRNTGGLRAIDFEFAHRRNKPVAAEESFFLAGVPAEAKVKRPLNQRMDEDPYPGKWRPFTGLRKSSFLHSRAWVQHVERVLVHPVWLFFNVARALVRRRQHNADRDATLAWAVVRRPGGS